MADKKEKIVAKYKKNSGFLSGIPGRDLTEVDWHNLDMDKKLQVQSSPMYKLLIPEIKPPAETPENLVKGDE